MNKDIIKFAKIFLIFLICFVIIDFGIGKICDKLLLNMPKNGDTSTCTLHYALTEIDSEVIIAGSSRAKHHYVSSIIKDSINLSVYNVGVNGLGTLPVSCVLNSILENNAPKVVIWEIGASSIINKTDLYHLRQYYYRDSLIRENFNKTEGDKLNIQMMVNSYLYNSALLKMINGYISPPVKTGTYGYLPLLGKISKTNAADSDIFCNETIDPLVKKNIQLIINKAKEKSVKLILVESPSFGEMKENNIIKEIESICLENNVIFVNNSQASAFVKNKDLFKDKSHLNNDGAIAYTNLFISQIKPYINSVIYEKIKSNDSRGYATGDHEISMTIPIDKSI